MSQQDKTNYKRKYNAENYERIGLYVPNGKKDIWKLLSSKNGMSLNAYIIQAIEEKIEREGNKYD